MNDAVAVNEVTILYGITVIVNAVIFAVGGLVRPLGVRCGLMVIPGVFIGTDTSSYSVARTRSFVHQLALLPSSSIYVGAVSIRYSSKYAT